MKRNTINYFTPLLITGVAFLLITCSSFMTIKGQFKGVNEKLAQRDFEGAAAQIEKTKKNLYQEKDQVMYYLDVGMLYHYMGNYEQSNEFLTKAEQAIEQYYTISISKAGLSLLLNDNATDYAGEDYEDIYINVFKALNYIGLGKKESAFVEIRRIDNKLKLLELKYKNLAKEYNKSEDAQLEIKTGTNNFYNSALARYLSMLLYRSENSWSDARIDRDKVYEAFNREANIYPFEKPNLDTAASPSKKARVNILGFAGRNPDKIGLTLRFKSDRDRLVLIETKETQQNRERLQGYASLYWKNISPDMYIKMEFPLMENTKSNISGIRVILTGKETKQLDMAMIESMEEVAKATFEVKAPMIYMKTIIRSIVKGVAAAAAKKKIREDNAKKSTNDKLLGGLLSLATDLAVEISENADLRIAHFFPGRAYIGEFEVDPGTYSVAVEYLSKSGGVIFRDDRGEVEVTNSGLNLIESFCLE
ncbi:MAG: hypothetical protein JW904_11600 [Spirochaetales bacterium]|nr:hypothetical protein [Spirochaetales bacterium]